MEALMAQTIWQTWVSLNIVKLLIWDFVLEMSIINHNRVGLLGGNWTRCIWERRVKKWFVMSCCPSVSGTMWVACLSGGGSVLVVQQRLCRLEAGWRPLHQTPTLRCCSAAVAAAVARSPHHHHPPGTCGRAEVKKPLSSHIKWTNVSPFKNVWKCGPRNFIWKNKSVLVLFLSIGNWKNPFSFSAQRMILKY